MHIDDMRIDLRHFLVAEAQPRHRVGADVVDEDVGGRDQRAQLLAVCLRLQVEHDRALVAVHGHEQRAHVLGFGVLGAVALAVAAGVLDLDHVRAQIAQRLRRIGPEDELGQVEHADTVQRPLLVGHGETSFDGRNSVAGRLRHGGAGATESDQNGGEGRMAAAVHQRRKGEGRDRPRLDGLVHHPEPTPNANAMPHKQVAQLLADKGCPSWWSQMIAVEYERARGGRKKNEREGGTYAVNVTKVMPVGLSKLFAAATGEKTRKDWFPRRRVRGDLEDQGQILARQVEEGPQAGIRLLRQGRGQIADRAGDRQASLRSRCRERTRRLEEGDGTSRKSTTTELGSQTLKRQFYFLSILMIVLGVALLIYFSRNGILRAMVRSPDLCVVVVMLVIVNSVLFVALTTRVRIFINEHAKSILRVGLAMLSFSLLSPVVLLCILIPLNITLNLPDHYLDDILWGNFGMGFIGMLVAMIPAHVNFFEYLRPQAKR